MDKQLRHGADPIPPAGAGAGPMSRAGRRPKTRAQSMVEFALVSPLLFTMALGILEFGWLFKSHMNLYYTARESARMGAVVGTTGGADLDYILPVVSNTMATMPYDNLIQVAIYHSGTDGNCVSPCHQNVYTRDSSGWNLVAPAGYSPWPPVERQDVEPTYILGIAIQYRHEFLINFLPGAVGSVVIQDHQIMPI